MNSKLFRLLFVAVFLFQSCSDSIPDNSTPKPPPANGNQELTIFFMNDTHGQINNFAKVKHIVDAAKAEGNVLVACAGDIFSGNPIVDNYSEKGFPIIDLMNQVGFDVSVLGNHEFDYGTEVLEDRLNQATFEWVCANVDMGTTGIAEPKEYVTLQVGELKVTFLGLVETGGKPGATIPSTHPWRVEKLQFEDYRDALPRYQDIKASEGSDLYIALTHLGTNRDFNIANNYPFFDMIIGGHSHQTINSTANGIPVFQAGSYSRLLGKINVSFTNGKVENVNMEYIDLENYQEEDASVKAAIDAYNDAPEFEEVVGNALSYHSGSELGCFYTDALRQYMNVDISFQNNGGIRAPIDQGPVTRYEIFSMDPFNNGSVVFTMTAKEIEDFFEQSGASLHVSGVTVARQGEDIYLLNENNEIIPEETVLTIGTNDYIPAVYENYFPREEAEIRPLTTAESLIEYLKTINSTIDYEGCDRYFNN